MPTSLRRVASLLVLSISLVNAAVTVHFVDGQAPIQTSTPGVYAGAQAYNPVVLDPPPVPSPAPSTNFSLPLQNGNHTGLSIPQSGAFLGFSIEFSVTNQIIGKNGTVLQVPFLNLMSNIQQRAGHVNVRIGGKSVDTSSLVENLGTQTQAILYGAAIPPPLVFTTGFISMLANVSSLVNARWYLGIPFNDTNNFRLGIAEYGEAILGDNLIGLQVGEQPDLYAPSGLRPYTYSVADYNTEFGKLVSAMVNTTTTTENVTENVASTNPLVRASKILIGPNIASGGWTPEQVWNTGFVDDHKQNLAALSVEHYPSNNCFSRTGTGQNISAQDVFASFLNHTAGVSLVQPYLNSAKIAQEAGKPLLMMETNSASCGGFPGLSDSFGAALWALDYGLQMAYSNFSGAMFHITGQNSSYNAFTAAPSAQGSVLQWTVGPVYYSSLVMAEVLGSSNQSQVLDLNANNGSIFTPAYGIYQKGIITKVALFNYVSDPSGASDCVADISVGSNSSKTTPSLVSVKYLSASSVSQKGNFTWAGQTFGGYYESNGLPQGAEDIKTVSCPNGVCKIKVPAPGFALVFLTNNALAEVDDTATKTFSTTVITIESPGATIDPSALATSNGHRRIKGHLGSTTRGKGVLESGAIGTIQSLPNIAILVAFVAFACYRSRTDFISPMACPYRC